MGAEIAVPMLLIVSLSLATVTELHDIAQEASESTIAYAEDATAALDCAYTARPLDECSPDLFNEDFKEQAERTRAILDDLAEKNHNHLEPKEKLRGFA
jgi:hypothetical protein